MINFDDYVNKNKKQHNLKSVCSYHHITHAFQSESTHNSCLNVKKLLAGNKREIWSLNDCSWTQIHNHLVYKQTLNHLAKPAILAKLSQSEVFVYELSDCGFESSCSHYNLKWPYIPDHPYRLLVIGSSGLGKKNALLNLINNQSDIDKIYWYAKDPHEVKY